MTRLRILEGSEVITALEKIGYKQVRQKGSHIRLMCEDKKSLTIPNHIIGRGLLRKILRDANLSIDEFNRLFPDKIRR